MKLILLIILSFCASTCFAKNRFLAFFDDYIQWKGYTKVDRSNPSQEYHDALKYVQENINQLCIFNSMEVEVQGIFNVQSKKVEAGEVNLLPGYHYHFFLKVNDSYFSHLVLDLFQNYNKETGNVYYEITTCY